MKKIILSGGGTGGSIMPLLAIFEIFKKKNFSQPYKFFWLGESGGPEENLIKREGIEFKAIYGGKWRRYFSFKNLFDAVKIIFGFWQSLFIFKKIRPNLIISAGSYISVPVVWAGFILKIPALIHQQDFVPGLANKLMAPFAKIITVTFEKSLSDYGRKAVWTGNLIRETLMASIDKATALKYFSLTDNLPVILVIGGSTGASFINNLIADSAEDLIKFCQVILVTGKGRHSGLRFPKVNFKTFDFLASNILAKALGAADIVISRCGMSFLSELSYLGKAAILIPIPNSHQEANAALFAEKKAAVVLNQSDLNKDYFIESLKSLLADKSKLKMLEENIKTAVKIDKDNVIVNLINSLIDKKSDERVDID